MCSKDFEYPYLHEKGKNKTNLNKLLSGTCVAETLDFP